MGQCSVRSEQLTLFTVICKTTYIFLFVLVLPWQFPVHLFFLNARVHRLTHRPTKSTLLLNLDRSQLVMKLIQ